MKTARDPLFAGARAEGQVSEARIALSQAQMTADTARRTLEVTGMAAPDFEIDTAVLEDTSTAQDIAGEVSSVDLGLLDAERKAAMAGVRVEETKAVQDPTWRAGLRYLNEGRDMAVRVGGSIPLARYDTNRDAIERAQADLAARAGEVRRIGAAILPGAERTVALVREAFNRGGFSYGDVI